MVGCLQSQIYVMNERKTSVLFLLISYWGLKKGSEVIKIVVEIDFPPKWNLFSEKDATFVSLREVLLT